MATVRKFPDLLAEYLSSLDEADSEATLRHRCLRFLEESLGISLAPSSPQGDSGGDFALEQRVFRGRVDAVLGRLVFEFKRDLADSQQDAERQLQVYLTDLHSQDASAVHTGVACDGRRFLVYRPGYGDDGEAALSLIGDLDLAQADDPEEARLWLEGLFAHFRAGRGAPTARGMVAALGPGSPTFRRAFPVLLFLFREVQDHSEVAVRYREWQSYLSIVYGSEVGDEALFVRHTYLSLVARLVARFLLESSRMLYSAEDLTETVNGDYFRRQAIDNFIEDDFFTWPLLPPVYESGVALTGRLAHSLGLYDFTGAAQDLLKGLYEEMVDPETRHDLGEYSTPDWLAQYMLEQELSLSENPDQSVLDPSCGSGTFLFTAIRAIVQSRLARGEDQLDALLHVLDQVMGMDAHPVAVTIARTNYLLALGELLHGPHPPVLLPVYLSNALLPPVSTTDTEPLGGYPEPLYTVETSEPGAVFEFPHSVVTSPEMLDWLFDRLTNYLNGVGARRRGQSEEDAIREVLVAFHNYLVSPKPKTPIPEPLNPFAAQAMERTAETLLRLFLEGKDHVWLFVLKNLPASSYLAHRRFDVVAGNPPWLSMRYIQNPQYRQRLRSQALQEYRLLESGETHLFTQMELATLFFARCADLYLKDGGRMALVMPRAVLTAAQHGGFTSFAFKEGGSLQLTLERVLDLEGVSPLFNVPSCVLVASKVGSGSATPYPVPGTVFRGQVPHRNAGWEEAAPALERSDTSFHREGGRLLPEGETG